MTLKSTFLNSLALWLVLCCSISNVNAQEITSIKQCVLENVEQCAKKAHSYYVAGDYENSNDYLKKTCELGLGWGCARLAASYDSGVGVEKNTTQAVNYYRKGCEGVEETTGRACYNLAVKYAEGSGVEVDNVEANKYYLKSCERVAKKTFGRSCNNLVLITHKV